MHQAIIAATGLYTPEQSISNVELVVAFNAYVERFNAENARAIAAGEVEALTPSSAEFVEKASGIKARFVMDKAGILDPAVMRPNMMSRHSSRRCKDPVTLPLRLTISSRVAMPGKVKFTSRLKAG